MQLFVASFVVLALVFLAMAVGVLLGRAPLRPGCGGGVGAACAACAGPCPRRHGLHTQGRGP